VTFPHAGPHQAGIACDSPTLRAVRPLEDLLDDAPAWPLLQSWIAEATNHVVVLPAIREDGEAVLQRLQITTRSPLGAVALETGGILIDHAWVRLLVCGSPRLRSTLASWNTISDEPEIEPLQHALIVGFDAVGGFFAINGGEFDGERGHVFFFTPDTLEWESLERGYFDFLHWTLTADLGSFYNELRWPGWEDELVDATGDLGFALYPPTFTKLGRPTSGVSRRLIPIRELWLVQQEYRRQLADVPSGAEISFQDPGLTRPSRQRAGTLL
jgi:hypothetical protein